MNYTFHNGGSVTSFNPKKRLYIGTVAVNALDMHAELVRDAGRPDVFILDNKGRYVNCDGIGMEMVA